MVVSNVKNIGNIEEVVIFLVSCVGADIFSSATLLQYQNVFCPSYKVFDIFGTATNRQIF